MQEVIVKYNGQIAALGYETEILNESYAILTLPEADIPALNNHTEIEYVELPKRLSLSIFESADRACIPAVQSEREYHLSGEGILVAVIDSGIDYRHEDFRNPDGTTRIAYIWDQTVPGTPPVGFLFGTEYSAQQINAALAGDDPLSALPHEDHVGHGTAVAGIAAGNGRASAGRELGVAYQAALLIVKLGERDNARFARTTEIMRALKYAYEKAQQLNMPLAVNISYGTNDGAHDGHSLFESFISDIADQWKSVIVIASGNEGAAKHHFQHTLKQGETVSVTFTVGIDRPALAVHLWKNFADDFASEIIAPSGVTSGVIVRHTSIPALIHLDGVRLRIDYIQPNHYQQGNSIAYYFVAGSSRKVITHGAWTIRITGSRIVDGNFDVWLPTLEEVTDKIAFLIPSLDTTLTLPSCAEKVVTVGGYDAPASTFASFSGRGYTRENVYVKPDLTAPAVNIRSCQAGGGYGLFTGTSFAAPFVTGSAALMMQWGIAQGHDPYLYGQRVKAFLTRGAERNASLRYPDNRWGYGTLCLKESMDFLRQYAAE